MTDLLIATTNPGKIVEIQDLLEGLPFRLLLPADLGIRLEVEETGGTYAENAALKALAYCAASGILTLADDSGLEVAALDGAPGLHSARYSPHPGAKGCRPARPAAAQSRRQAAALAGALCVRRGHRRPRRAAAVR